MPAYTISQLEATLGSYVESGALTFHQMMEQLLPRMYRMGMWPDLCYEVSFSGEYGYISLPLDTAGVLACTVNDRPRPTRSLWHDVRISGRSSFLSSYYGIVDDGYYPVLLDMKDVQGVDDPEDVGQINAYLQGTSNPVDATAYAGTIGIVGATTLGRRSALTQATSGDLRFTSEAAVPDSLEIAGGPFDGSVSGGPFTFPDLIYFKETNGKSEYTDTGVAIPGIPSGARIYWTGSAWVAVRYSSSFVDYQASSSDDTATPDLAYFDSPTIGDGDISSITLTAGTPSQAITEITSITYNDIPAALDLVDPNFPDKVIATIPVGSGVIRYRRFRTPEKSDSCTVHLLLKRDAPSYIDDDTVVHLGNVGAIKNGMLAIIDEDSGDRVKAKDSWLEVQQILDEELQAVMGAAKPTLKLDFGPCPPIQSIM